MDGLSTLRGRLRAECGVEVVETTPLTHAVNNNNRLFRLDTADGRSLLAKLYYRGDQLQRRRLEREFDRLSALASRAFGRVPRPVLRDDEAYWGVYTFEPGVAKPPTVWTPGDVVAVAQFAAKLHAFGPNDVRQPLGLGLGAALSPADNRRRWRERLASDLALTPRALREEIEMAVRMVDELRCSEEALPRDRWRLVHSDFAPHNILLDRAGLCVVDWESAGWDDPSLQILDFVLHEATRGLAPELTRLVLTTYLAAHPLDDAERERWRQMY